MKRAAVVVLLLFGLAVPAWRIMAPQAPAAPPNVLLVTIDTLRADRVGAYGAPAGLTPTIRPWGTSRASMSPVFLEQPCCVVENSNWR